MLTMNNADPIGIATLKAITMPADMNASGHLFGGWIMSQTDLAGGILAKDIAKGSIVTACVNHLNFRRPAFLGDFIACHAHCLKTGTSSMIISVELWARRIAENGLSNNELISDAELTYVSIDSAFKSKPLPKNAQFFDAQKDHLDRLNLSLNG